MFTLPFLLLLAACGPEKKALRETHREEATLTERADRCWAALRWGDTAAASACVSETDDRVAYERWVASASAEKRPGPRLFRWTSCPRAARDCSAPAATR